ncbi:nucleotidyltransferase domain-containing protein [Candidatus Bathyarchaeota archaeon]|nr:nucleotidyltransferase domain-containing protein [Candidatus Bathyarchaeota archaeon]
MQNQTTKDLDTLFDKENRVLIAYLFGSYAKGTQTTESDVDIAVLLSETPQKMLEYYLHLVNELSRVLGNNVDLIILNTAPPLLKHQTIKHGKLVYCRDEKARIEFEARAQNEYLDFARAIARYNECLIKEVLAQKKA